MVRASGSVDRGFISAVGGALADVSFYPPVTEAVSGADETIWLRREEMGGETVRWDVLGPNGQRVASVTLPAALRILRASLEALWAVELDDLDVPFVVQLRVDPPGVGGGP